MVVDEDLLYRRVRHDWTVVDGDAVRLTSQAFNDRLFKPSVNRCSIWPDPVCSKVDASDGVVQLLAGEVRQIGGVVHNPAAAIDQQVAYKLEVIARPIALDNAEGLPENPSHAQIESDPMVESRSRFDKIKDALSRLAERRPYAVNPTRP